jgi:sec-independent protein translocase protein TatB
MFGIGLPELILIMAVALIVVGPEKLPGLARSLAKQLVELKKAANVLKESLRDDEMKNEDRDSSLPIGFSRPEELAEAGRRADAINHSSESAVEATSSGPDDEGQAAGATVVEDKRSEAPGEGAAADSVKPDEAGSVDSGDSPAPAEKEA